MLNYDKLTNPTPIEKMIPKLEKKLFRKLALTNLKPNNMSSYPILVVYSPVSYGKACAKLFCRIFFTNQKKNVFLSTNITETRNGRIEFFEGYFECLYDFIFPPKKPPLFSVHGIHFLFSWRRSLRGKWAFFEKSK